MHSDLRALLNRVLWDDEYDRFKVSVWYLDRGQKECLAVITGDAITDVQQQFFETQSSVIPIHRIRRITYDDLVLAER